VNKKFEVSVLVVMCLFLLVGLSIFSVATAEHSKTWYFAEGYVSDEVVEWLLILNPSNDDAHTDVTLFYEDGIIKSFSKDIPAHSKGGVKLNDYADAGKAFGTRIESNQPIVAQLAHYEPAGCHGSIGSTELARTWYFGEGYVSSEVVEWLGILNPSNDDAHTTITLYYEDGRTEFFSKDIPAHSKGGVKLNDYADAGKAFGTRIDSDQPIVAQLAHYEPAGGHGSIGSTELAKTWYFGEGYVSGEVVEWLGILNPTNEDAHTTITLYYEDGRTEFFSKDIPARSKGGVKLNDYADAGKAFGTRIDSDQPIVIQLAHYEPAGGHGSIGAILKEVIPTPTPTPTLTPSPSPSPTPSPSPSPSPTLIPSPTPTPTPTPTSTITPTPSFTPTPTIAPTPSLSEIIDEELKKLPIGQIVFNPPENMTVGKEERIEVRITQNLTENLTEGLIGLGVPQIEKIKVSTFMNVRLTGDNFDIDRLFIDEEQIVGSDEFTQWAWDVTPLKSGVQVLHLFVAVWIVIDAAEGKRDYPVVDKQICVKVNHIDDNEKIPLWENHIVKAIISIIGMIIAGILVYTITQGPPKIFSKIAENIKEKIGKK